MTSETSMPDAQGDRFTHSTFALLTSNVTGAVLGVAFWAVAAHLYRKSYVGYGVAEIAAMTLVANFALLNLGTVFPRLLFAAGDQAGRVLRTGYLASISIAVVGSVVFLAVTGHHSYLTSGLISPLVFVVGVVLWAVFTIEDAALVGFRKTFWVPVENTSFSIGKVALLFLFAVVAPRTGVFNAWILPVVACVIPVNYYLFKRVLPAHERRFVGRSVLPERKVIGSVVLGEYVGGIAFTAMATVPALLIYGQLGRVSAAYFQTPWIAGTSFDLLLFSFATSVIVEASARPATAGATVRRAVRLAALILTPSMVMLLVGAPYFLRILGTSYANHGTRLLQAVALALPFMAVNVLYVTFARLARRVRRVLIVQVSIATISLSLTAVLLGHLGITGAGVGFLVSQAAVACVVLPSVVRQYRRPGMTPGFLDSGSMVAGASDQPTAPSSIDGAASGDPRRVAEDL